jgi:hypothetical protein
MLSCTSTTKISTEKLDAMKSEITALRSKVDSLEAELKYNKEIEALLSHDSLLFSYRRTPCLGTCPVFTFKVYKDGWATYEGSKHVDLMGVYTAELTASQLMRVEDIFKEAHFYTFNDSYDDSRQDIPSIIIEYHGVHGVKKVLARTSIPHSFRKLSVDLQEFADELKWIPAN